MKMNTNDPDPRVAGQSDDPRVDATPDLRRTSTPLAGGEPTADDAMKNDSPDDGIMEDVLTEERDVSPERREEVAHTQAQDP